MKNFALSLTLSACISMLLFSCSGETSQSDNPLETAPHLTTELILEITETEDILFSYLNNLVVDARDNLLFIDPQQMNVYYYDIDGNLLQQFGGEGGGPGEFGRMYRIRLLDDYSLIVSDASRTDSKFVFDGGKWVYDDYFSFGSNLDLRVGMWDKVGPETWLISEHVPIMQPPTSPEIVTRDIAYHLLDDSENIIVENFVTRTHREATVLGPHQGGFRVSELPFAEINFLNVHNQYIYSGENTELRIHKMNAQKDTVQVFTANIERRPIHSDDYPDRIKNAGSDSFEREVRKFIPELFPIYRHIRVADNDEVWVNLYSEEDQPNWLVFNPDGSIKGLINLDRDFNLYEIRNNKIYGIAKDEDELPSVQVFELI